MDFYSKNQIKSEKSLLSFIHIPRLISYRMNIDLTGGSKQRSPQIQQLLMEAKYFVLIISDFCVL